MVQFLFKIRPESGVEVWLASLLNFSLPVWTYFILSDRSKRGATLGKRLLRVHVADRSDPDRSPSLRQAALRSLVKLLPWELVHFSAFGLAGDFSVFSVVQALGLGLGNLLTITYLAVALATTGRRSVHDFVANTIVAESRARNLGNFPS